MARIVDPNAPDDFLPAIEKTDTQWADTLAGYFFSNFAIIATGLGMAAVLSAISFLVVCFTVVAVSGLAVTRGRVLNRQRMYRKDPDKYVVDTEKMQSPMVRPIQELSKSMQAFEHAAKQMKAETVEAVAVNRNHLAREVWETAQLCMAMEALYNLEVTDATQNRSKEALREITRRTGMIQQIVATATDNIVTAKLDSTFDGNFERLQELVTEQRSKQLALEAMTPSTRHDREIEATEDPKKREAQLRADVEWARKQRAW